MTPPNFLVFVTDQQRADHLGCYGNPVLRTPNVDRLAARGVRLERHYVASPVCMPNRATLLTGLMPSVHGVRHNGIELPLEHPALPGLLREAGYATAMVGKSHLQNFTQLPAQYGAAAPGGAGRTSAGGHGHGLEAPENWADPAYRVATPYYGFDAVDLVTRHGDRCGGDYLRWALEREPALESLRGRDHALPAPGYVTREGWRTRVPVHAYSTTFVAERTIERLAELASAPDRPFFLWCSFPDPHHPWTPPGEYFGRHRPEDIALPAAYWDRPRPTGLPHLDHYLDQRDRAADRAPQAVTPVHACSPREAQEAIALTYDLLALIDDAVGRVVDALDRLALGRDTVVVFTSDHGDYMGDHQLLLKSQLHYQGLLRTPFVWADPARPEAAGATRDTVTGAIDLARTVLDRAGLAAPAGMQGASLLSTLEDGRGDPGRGLLVEDESHRALPWLGRRARVRTLLTRAHRLSLYSDLAWGELYDLENDPLELRNLWDAPGAAGLRSALLEQLAQRMMEADDATRMPTRFA